MTRRTGFTLAEALLSLGLVFILLGIVASLTTLYATIMRKADKKQSSLYAAKVALDEVSRNLNQAIAVDAPAPGATGSTLSLQRIDPWNAGRLPDLAAPPLPSPPASWIPHDPAHRQAVLFSLDTSDPTSAALMRTTSYSDGTSESEVICEGLSGVSFTREDHSTTVTVTVEEDGRIIPLTVEIFGPRPERLVRP